MAAAADLLIGEFIRTLDERFRLAIPPELMRVNGSNEWGWLVYACHAGGASVAFADGAVRFVGEGTSVQVLGQLATRAGGEPVSLD